MFDDNISHAIAFAPFVDNATYGIASFPISWPCLSFAIAKCPILRYYSFYDNVTYAMGNHIHFIAMFPILWQLHE